MSQAPLVGIVVVSHSAPLARAAVALAEEMLHGTSVRIEVAAGLDEHTLGTDAMKILAALTAADVGAGVVVLMDLGSAVLSTELALDLLDDDARDRVLLCPAPVVEGLVVAAVAAAGGAPRHEVCAEAVAALAGKQAHLGSAGPGDVPGAGAPPRADGGTCESPDPDGGGVPRGVDEPVPARVGRFTVVNPHGLHARPAARLVQEVRSLDAAVTVRNVTTGSVAVPASSLSRVATLGALLGHEVEVATTGNQAREALDHVLALAGRAFDEETTPPPTTGGAGVAHAATSPVPSRDGGRPASPGIGVGPVWSARSAEPIDVPDATTDDPAADWRRVREAIADVRRAVQHSRARTARDVGEADATIFDAHVMLLDDTDLLDDVRTRIDAGQAGAPAWAATIGRVEADFAGLDDPYLQARAADVRAVGDQVLRVLLRIPAVTAKGVGVLVAADLTPADVADLDADRVVAVVLAQGSPTSHSAILARAKGIPVVVGAGAGVLAIPAGTVVAVDGTTGEIVVDPAPDVRAAFRYRAGVLAEARATALSHAADAATTTDGTGVLIAANLGSVDDAALAQVSGADLAGLVRTEFLFLGRAQAPDVDEQEKTYLALAEALGGARLTLRTLDVGGDKPLDYVPMSAEANPFLGVRGLRLSLARPGLLADQLLAIVRTARATPVSVMFPMVSTVAELVEARALLDEAVARDGRGIPAGLQVGIMVEVPATALKAARFAPLVDFFSIGTNDLTQYTMAAERGNDAVAAVGDPYDPGVLRLIQAVCDASGDALVAVCGELAADDLATPLLLGLGVRELSMSATAIPQVKEVVRSTDLAVARRLAALAVGAEGPDDVRGMLATSARQQGSP